MCGTAQCKGKARRGIVLQRQSYTAKRYARAERCRSLQRFSNGGRWSAKAWLGLAQFSLAKEKKSIDLKKTRREKKEMKRKYRIREGSIVWHLRNFIEFGLGLTLGAAIGCGFVVVSQYVLF